MKRIFSLILLSVTTALFAGDTNSNWTPTFTLRSVFASKYLAFGSGGVLYDKPVVQSDIFVSFKNGFYADLWNSTPFEGFNENFGTEVDYGIGWSGSMSAFHLNGWISDVTIDIGTTYFDEPHIFSFGSCDILYNHVKLSKPFKWFTVNGYFENYIAMPDSPYKGGSIYALGASRDVNVSKLLNAGFMLALAYDDGGFGCDDGLLLRGNFILNWRLNKHLTLVLPQVNYYAPLTVDDSRDLDAVVFGGVSYRF